MIIYNVSQSHAFFGKTQTGIGAFLSKEQASDSFELPVTVRTSQCMEMISPPQGPLTYTIFQGKKAPYSKAEMIFPPSLNKTTLQRIANAYASAERCCFVPAPTLLFNILQEDIFNALRKRARLLSPTTLNEFILAHRVELVAKMKLQQKTLPPRLWKIPSARAHLLTLPDQLDDEPSSLYVYALSIKNGPTGFYEKRDTLLVPFHNHTSVQPPSIAITKSTSLPPIYSFLLEKRIPFLMKMWLVSYESPHSTSQRVVTEACCQKTMSAYLTHNVSLLTRAKLSIQLIDLFQALIRIEAYPLKLDANTLFIQTDQTGNDTIRFNASDCIRPSHAEETSLSLIKTHLLLGSLLYRLKWNRSLLQHVSQERENVNNNDFPHFINNELTRLREEGDEVDHCLASLLSSNRPPLSSLDEIATKVIQWKRSLVDDTQEVH